MIKSVRPQARKVSIGAYRLQSYASKKKENPVATSWDLVDQEERDRWGRKTRFGGNEVKVRLVPKDKKFDSIGAYRLQRFASKKKENTVATSWDRSTCR